MGKQKIIEAAKRKGLSVESANWVVHTYKSASFGEWQVVFGREMARLYSKPERLRFSHTAEVLDWIDSLEPVTHGEDE